MKKSEKPYLIIDGDDAFPDFGNPEWVEKMLAAGRKYAAQHPEPKTAQQQNEPKPSSSSGG